MEHFGVLNSLIKEHNKKYNEQRRLYRKLGKLRKDSWSGTISSYTIYHHEPKYSNPNRLSNYDGRYAFPYEVITDKKELVAYRKWCRVAAKWRRVKLEARELLNGIRAVGKVYGTKVQTRSEDGFSFNRPFFITIGDRKMPIKKFMDDHMFDEIILKGEIT